MEQKTYMRSIRSSGVWNGLLSACPGVGNLRPLQISAGVPGGGGGMVLPGGALRDNTKKGCVADYSTAKFTRLECLGLSLIPPKREEECLANCFQSEDL